MNKLFLALLLPVFALGLNAQETSKKEKPACASCCKDGKACDKCKDAKACKEACKDACKDKKACAKPADKKS
jgi:hypothetical protein